VLQIDNLVFIDMADIDNLKDPVLAKKISSDFSNVTNSILSLSPFYKDHLFDQAPSRSAGPSEFNLRAGSTDFSLLVKNYLTDQSKIMLLCCVVENSIAGSQAVEYCHKIKAYFKGDAIEDDTTELSKTGDVNMSTFTETANLETVKAFKQLAGLFSEVEKTKAFIDRMYDAKRTGEGPNRTNAQLKNLVETLRDDVGELLSLLGSTFTKY